MMSAMPADQRRVLATASLSALFGLVAFLPFVSVLGPFVGLFFSFSAPLSRAIDGAEIALPTPFLFAFVVIGLIAAIAAIVTGRRLRQVQPRVRGLIGGLATTGLVLGSLSLLIDLLGLILLGITARSFG
jgi:hypothetical protein